jgi:hypothetical protein
MRRLKKLGMSEYAKRFAENDIEFDTRLAAAIAWPTATGPWSGRTCLDTSIA